MELGADAWGPSAHPRIDVTVERLSNVYCVLGCRQLVLTCRGQEPDV